jgi:hypothetical protein
MVVYRHERVNGTAVRAECKWIRIHLGWNKRKSGSGGVQVTHLKINFKLGLHWANDT